LKRFPAFLGILGALFSIVIAYDQLGEGAAGKLLKSLGIPVLLAIVVYWTVPITSYLFLLALKAAIVYGIKLVHSLYLKRGLSRIQYVEFDSSQVLSKIRLAKSQGLLSKEDEQQAETRIRDLQNIEFDLLELLDDPNGWASRRGIPFPNWEKARLSQLLEWAIPMLRGKEDEYYLAVKKLYERGLVLPKPETLDLFVSHDDLQQSMTTQLGHKVAHLLRPDRINGK